MTALQDDAKNMPKTIQANIQTGQLHILGFDVPLPIRGTGFFEVRASDVRCVIRLRRWCVDGALVRRRARAGM